MENLIFESVEFDVDNKEFIVHNGSVGKYSYKDVKKCRIKNEDAKFRGKTTPFTHCVLSGPGQTYGILERKFYVGLEVVMKNNQIVAIYISDDKTMMNTDIYNRDIEVAKKIQRLFNKAIDKYA